MNFQKTKYRNAMLFIFLVAVLSFMLIPASFAEIVLYPNPNSQTTCDQGSFMANTMCYLNYPISMPGTSSPISAIGLLGVVSVLFAMIYVVLKYVPIFNDKESKGPRIAVTIGLILLLLFATPLLNMVIPMLDFGGGLAIIGSFIVGLIILFVALYSTGAHNVARGFTNHAAANKEISEARKSNFEIRKEMKDLSAEKSIDKRVMEDIKKLSGNDLDSQIDQMIRQLQQLLYHGNVISIRKREDIIHSVANRIKLITRQKIPVIKNLETTFSVNNQRLIELAKLTDLNEADVLNEISRVAKNPIGKKKKSEDELKNEINKLKNMIAQFRVDSTNLKNDIEKLIRMKETEENVERSILRILREYMNDPDNKKMITDAIQYLEKLKTYDQNDVERLIKSLSKNRIPDWEKQINKWYKIYRKLGIVENNILHKFP